MVKKKNYISVEDASIESLKKDYNAIRQEKLEFEERIKNLEKSLQKERIDFIQVLGIFVALFTFIAVNVQIFNKVNDLGSAIWFMLTMGGIIITILLVISIIVDNKFNDNFLEGLRFREKLKRIIFNKTCLLIILAISEIGIGLYFTYKNPIKLNPSGNEKIQIDANINSTEADTIEIKSANLLDIEQN